MADLEQRIHTWTATAVADVEPLTLDEILERAQRVQLADAPAADPQRGPRRRWLAAAAVVVLLAATFAAIGLLRPHDGDVADTDLSPTMSRLLELGPAEFPAAGEYDVSGGGWMDVERARETAGLEPPSPDASDEERAVYLEELYLTTGAAPVRVGAMSSDQLDWWLEIAIDPTTVDGYVGWGTFPETRVVLLGDFDISAIDEAARTNSGAERLVVDEYRGVTTYAWGDDGELLPLESPDDFPGFTSLRLALVDDQTILIARTTGALQEMIDRALDGGPTVADEPAMAMLGSLDDVYGFDLFTMQGRPYAASTVFMAAPWEPGDPQRLVTALVAPGEQPGALAEQVQSDADAALARAVDDGVEELQDAELEVGIDGDVIWIDLVGAPELNPRDPENPDYEYAITRPLVMSLDIASKDAEESSDESAIDDVMPRLAELGPPELSASTEWVDLARARAELGIAKPAPGASDEELGDYYGPLIDDAGLSPANPGNNMTGGGGSSTFWATLGVDTSQVDGSWGSRFDLAVGQVVVLGPFGPDGLAASVGDAVGMSGESDPPAEGDHRGVTTYSWPGTDPTLMNEYYGFGRLGQGDELHVAAIEGAVFVASVIGELHAMIDRSLDDHPTVFDDPGTSALLSAHLDEGAWALRTWPGTPESGIAVTAYGSGPATDGHRWASMLITGDDLEAEAARIQAAGDAVMDQFRADLASPLDAMQVRVGTLGPVVVVDLVNFSARPSSVVGTMSPDVSAVDGEIPEDFFPALFGALTPGTPIDGAFG